ncbi:YHS domain-containing protein [Candidatus Woesearchaeota archaeon]|nr:YHS domain-containing protein [Candidatus Woesearchaeota archaeon]
MIFGLFKKTDPMCGMKEEKGKGISEEGHWFCSEKCLKDFRSSEKKHAKKDSHGGHGGHGCCP